MAQSDQSVQNATFPSVRADINDNLAALFSQSSGNSEPTVKVAFQPWVDTSSSPPVWKIRNGSNSSWITVGVLDPAGFQVGGITPIANGGTGAITAALALAALLPSQAGNAGKGLVTDGTTATWTTINGITSGTSVASTSGTTIDFISIPSTVKRITVMFSGVSTNGTSTPQIQLGAGSVVTSGYNSCGSVIFGTTVADTANSTTGLIIGAGGDAGDARHGSAVLTLIGSNIWTISGTLGYSNSNVACFFGGSVALSGTLDRVRISTVSGTDTFDAGSINILYES
jgi:hypothetical protein